MKAALDVWSANLNNDTLMLITGIEGNKLHVMKNYFTGLVVTLFLTQNFSAYACDPIPLTECGDAKIKFDEKSLKKLIAKSKEFDELLDKYIAKANKDKPYPSDSCFNQNLYSLQLYSVSTAASEKSGLTCHAHLDLFRAKFDPYKSAEMKYAFSDSVPAEVKKLISEIELARREFTIHNKN